MRSQKTLIFFFVTSLLVIGLSFVLIPAAPVQAQCKNVSSCKNCHEIQGTFSVANNGIWHSQHALYDFCDVCHGGNKTAADKQTAHVGITTKLNDMTQGCTNCHAADLDPKLKSYSDVLGVQVQAPISSPACTPTPAYFEGGALFTNPNPQNSVPTSQAPTNGSQTTSGTPTTPIVNATGNLILRILLAVLVLGGFILVLQNEQHNFLPSNAEREEMAKKAKPVIDREAINQGIDELSLESQAELMRLLDDPDEAEKVLRKLSKGTDK